MKTTVTDVKIRVTEKKTGATEEKTFGINERIFVMREEPVGASTDVKMCGIAAKTAAMEPKI